MRICSQFLYKWIPISSLLKIFLLKFYANGFPYILFSHQFFSSSFLQIGTYVFFFQDLYETTICRSNSWTNEFCSKFHKSTQVWSSIKNYSFRTNPLLANPIDSNQLSLKLCLKSIVPWKLHGSTWVIMYDGVVLDYIRISCSFYLWWIACKV